MSALTKTLIEAIKTMPEPMQREILDYLAFLKVRQSAQTEGRENLLALAHGAWAADWTTLEEDEAWHDL